MEDGGEGNCCEFFEDFESAGEKAVLPPGVYTLHDLRAFGRTKKWCPYFLARNMIAFANVVVYNYQYYARPEGGELGVELVGKGVYRGVRRSAQHR